MSLGNNDLLDVSSTFPCPDRKKFLIGLLKVLGGHKVEVTFSGGGDSGEIDEASLLNAEGQIISLNGVTLDWHHTTSHIDQVKGGWVKTTKVVNKSLTDVLVQITENALEESGHDWYNNDGGEGSLTIDLSQDPVAIDLQVGVRYTETTWHNYQLHTEDESEEEEDDAPNAP